MWNRITVPALLALLLASCGGTAATTTTTAAHDHENDHGEAAGFEWDGGQVPTVEVTVTEADTPGLWEVRAEITNFEFSSPDRIDHVPGQGHTHVWVDDRLISMAYEAIVQVADLEPGTHNARVTLANNAHTDYTAGGEVIGGSSVFEVSGEATMPDVTAAITVAGGTVSGIDGRLSASVGDFVEVTITADVADAIHLHGYDIMLELEPGTPAVLRFIADVPGIFEAELEGSGLPLFEIQVG